MASALCFVVLLCLTCGLWTGANAQAKEQPEEDCCLRCPAGWTQFGDHCYIFQFTPKDWADAETTCVAIAGNLAAVHTKEQYTFIKDMIKRSTGSDVETWIGGEDATKEGVWLWSDGSKFDFKLWPAGEPNNAGGAENCLEMNYNGT
ncbi:galactose-specific lectin nattectin-like [Anabas testudineus]|uniref:galactose-specific lectin nattectin-like n=1 Tax=Anabas testudineus TaxID=64144 RepID=UPI00143D4010|nr:galactose-specific lectin nattectin-like [Anabas testudineus]